jgi:hypothetical protein
VPILPAFSTADLPAAAAYATLFVDRLRRLGHDRTCVGVIGNASVCNINGIAVASSSVGLPGFDLQPNVMSSMLVQSGSVWRFCSFHTSHAALQLGNSSADQMLVYQSCTMAGGIVVTGDSRGYARTFDIDTYAPITTSSPRDMSEAVVAVQRNIAIVSGVGGEAAQVCDESRQLRPWWAVALCAQASLEPGALVCRFNINSDPRLALCRFVTASGTERDRFFVRSEVPQRNKRPLFFVQPTPLVFLARSTSFNLGISMLVPSTPVTLYWWLVEARLAPRIAPSPQALMAMGQKSTLDTSVFRVFPFSNLSMDSSYRVYLYAIDNDYPQPNALPTVRVVRVSTGDLDYRPPSFSFPYPQVAVYPDVGSFSLRLATDVPSEIFFLASTILHTSQEVIERGLRFVTSDGAIISSVVSWANASFELPISGGDVFASMQFVLRDLSPPFDSSAEPIDVEFSVADSTPPTLLPNSLRVLDAGPRWLLIGAQASENIQAFFTLAAPEDATDTPSAGQARTGRLANNDYGLAFRKEFGYPNVTVNISTSFVPQPNTTYVVFVTIEDLSSSRNVQQIVYRLDGARTPPAHELRPPAFVVAPAASAVSSSSASVLLSTDEAGTCYLVAMPNVSAIAQVRPSGGQVRSAQRADGQPAPLAGQCVPDAQTLSCAVELEGLAAGTAYVGYAACEDGFRNIAGEGTAFAFATLSVVEAPSLRVVVATVDEWSVELAVDLGVTNASWRELFAVVVANNTRDAALPLSAFDVEKGAGFSGAAEPRNRRPTRAVDGAASTSVRVRALRGATDYAAFVVAKNSMFVPPRYSNVALCEFRTHAMPSDRDIGIATQMRLLTEGLTPRTHAETIEALQRELLAAFPNQPLYHWTLEDSGESEGDVVDVVVTVRPPEADELFAALLDRVGDGSVNKSNSFSSALTPLLSTVRGPLLLDAEVAFERCAGTDEWVAYQTSQRCSEQPPPPQPPPPPPSTSTDPQHSSGGGSSAGAVVGGVFGALAAGLLVFLCVWLWRRRKAREFRPVDEGETELAGKTFEDSRVGEQTEIVPTRVDDDSTRDV